MNLRQRYEMLYSKAASPKSVDFGRPAIFRFEKYCKHCNSGLGKPKREDRRTAKALFRKGFCSSHCFAKGAVCSSQALVSGDHSVRSKNHVVEEFAFISKEIERQESSNAPIVNMALYADRTFRLLSEKMRWMEIQTGQAYYPNKFYRLLERATI